MQKRLLLIVLAFAFLLVGCGATKPENERSEVDQMKENIENAMYEVLGDDLKKLSEHELVATLEYAFKDGTGDGIQYCEPSLCSLSCNPGRIGYAPN